MKRQSIADLNSPETLRLAKEIGLPVNLDKFSFDKKTGLQVEVKPKRKGRTPGQPNQTEAEFGRMLQRRVDEGKLLSFLYEPVKLKVGVPVCWYCPDFMGIEPTGQIVFWEVKGSYVWGDSIVKFKAAAHQFKMFRFELWKKGKTDGWSQMY